MKSKIYNLIILDESGSMSGIVPQTISGCNETINTIKAAQEQFSDTQEHYVSIYAFQSDGKLPSRYLIKNVPASAVEHISEKDYQPWGCTPLYDAVGSTLNDLKVSTSVEKGSIANVTIITDGMENTSRHYTLKDVARMIDAFKELGWSFNFIGANIDVKKAAMQLNIDNTMEFTQDDEGSAQMFEKERKARMAWMKRTSDAIKFCYDCSADRDEDFKKRMKEASKGYFDEEK